MAFSIQFVRNISTTSSLLLRRLSKRSNPGLGYQINALEDAAEIIQSDPEGFAALEGDLAEAHKSHKQHELELQRQKEKIRQYIVQNKYFRQEPLPNLLTYAEKEQIKFLHSSDNEEWTVERLAESFPASAETICKILKARWSPMSEKRIRAHDESVLKNWERFKKGEFSTKLSRELQEHLNKFIHRDLKDINILPDSSKTFQKKKWQKPKSSEFSSIIMSLRSKDKETASNLTQLSDGKTKENFKEVATNKDYSDTYLLGEIKNKKSITIHEFKEKNQQLVNTDILANNSDKSLEEVAAQEFKNTTGTGIISKLKQSAATSDSLVMDYTDRFASNEVVISEDDRKRYGMSILKE